LLWFAPAAAQSSASLPEFPACVATTQPELPTRWRAATLLAPFVVDQLYVGEFVYDGPSSLMRATIYGLESGALDLLVTDTNTYQLVGPHAAPTGCANLGRVFSSPSARWLSPKAVCVGESQFGKTTAEWWKTPGIGPRANWLWFNKATRLPSRAVFTATSPTP